MSVSKIASTGKEASAYKGRLRNILNPAYTKNARIIISKVICLAFFAVNIKERAKIATESLKIKTGKRKPPKSARKESVWFSTILYPYSFSTLKGKNAP